MYFWPIFSFIYLIIFFPSPSVTIKSLRKKCAQERHPVREFFFCLFQHQGQRLSLSRAGNGTWPRFLSPGLQACRGSIWPLGHMITASPGRIQRRCISVGELGDFLLNRKWESGQPCLAGTTKWGKTNGLMVGRWRGRGLLTVSISWEDLLLFSLWPSTFVFALFPAGGSRDKNGGTLPFSLTDCFLVFYVSFRRTTVFMENKQKVKMFQWHLLGGRGGIFSEELLWTRACVYVSSSVCVFFSSKSWFIQKGKKTTLFFPMKFWEECLRSSSRPFFSSPGVRDTFLNSWSSKLQQKTQRTAVFSGTNDVPLHLKSRSFPVSSKKTLFTPENAAVIRRLLAYNVCAYLTGGIHAAHHQTGTRSAVIFACQLRRREASRSRSIMHLNNLRKKTKTCMAAAAAAANQWSGEKRK